MENASKAIIIAGSIMLTVIVASFMVYLFRKTDAGTEQMYMQISQVEADRFNQKFIIYENYVARKDNEGNIANPLTIQDVLSIINLAKETNLNNRIGASIKVTAKDIWTIEGIKNKDLLEDIDYNAMLHKNLGNKYTCELKYAENSNLIGEIEIIKIK